MKQNYARNYQRVQAISATKIGQVALLLDHCVRLLDRAIAAIHANQMEDLYLHLDQTIVILCTIENSLDEEASEYAKGLKSFFQKMTRGLQEVLYQGNADLCAKIQTCLLGMANIWHKADKEPVEKEETLSGAPGTGENNVYPTTRENLQISV